MDDLDRWTRVLPLGNGAFGEVHLAWDNVDGRWVAVKRFTGQDELGLLRMVIESRIRVSHPNLVRTVAFRLVDDRAWLVTELARGGSLRALVARTGALPWGWVVEAVDQILAALTALHATGVVHRDLKPANLLLGSVGPRPPHLLVGDFGIATWRTVSMTGIGAAIGTPGYLAPEYLDGQQPSPATDLFAVGVLAAELLAGHRLVHYSNASPTLPSSWADDLPVPPAVPTPLATVLRRMAAPDPRRRYTDCTQAREALLAVAPPASRGDLTVVSVPDLLAAVPPGWTSEGPEQPTTALPTTTPKPTPPKPETSPNLASLPELETPPELENPLAPENADPVNLVGLPIDGGSTALVLEDPPTELQSGPSTSPPSGSPTSSAASPTGSSTSPPSGPSTSPAASPTGSSTSPPSGPPTSSAASPTGSSTHPPSGPSTQPPTGPATAHIVQPSRPTTPPAGSQLAAPNPAAPPTETQPAPATSPAGSPSTLAGGLATQSPFSTSGSSTGPPTGSATSLAAAPASGSSTSPVSGSSTHPPNGSATSPATPPSGSAIPSKAQRKARRRRKAKRVVLLVVLLILVGGAGTLWWAATHRAIPGHASATGSPTGEPGPAGRWKPTIVETCTKVELDRKRTGANGLERCQRTNTTDDPQSWVEAPPGGFPKSNAAGPFPGEQCTTNSDKNYSPVGDHVECIEKTWQVIA